mmetsp:Transcript_46198/g.72284  ORF Transcript_46198/g.72284 Transcript_46198/m.72284 type:complete len:281 (-) Transcript_46198:64-906(-)
MGTNLVEVGEAVQGLAAGELVVELHLGDVVHGDVVVGHEQGALVHGHVLEHALRVALEALGQLLGLVGVVVDEGRHGARVGRLGLTGKGHVLGDVLVVAHVHANAALFGVGSHALQLSHGWGAGLLKVNVANALVNALAQQSGVISSAAGNQSDGLLAGGDAHILDGVVELGRMAGLGLLHELGKGLAGIRVGTATQEPRLHNVGELTAGALAVQEVDAVVPTHTPLRHTAAHEHDAHLVLEEGGAPEAHLGELHLATSSEGRDSSEGRGEHLREEDRGP